MLHASIRVVSLSSRPGLTGPTKGKGKKLRQSNPVQVQRMFPSVFAWQVHCMGPCVLLTAMVDDAVLCHSLQLQSKLSTAHMQSRVLTDASLQKYIQNGRSTTPAGINFVLPFSATRPDPLQFRAADGVVGSCVQPARAQKNTAHDCIRSQNDCKQTKATGIEPAATGARKSQRQ